MVGGAGVMTRTTKSPSTELFVTETFPGRVVKTLLPIYGDFYKAHCYTLMRLRSCGLPWTMVCPGYDCTIFTFTSVMIS